MATQMYIMNKLSSDTEEKGDSKEVNFIQIPIK